MYVFLTRCYFKNVRLLNIFQLKLGNIREVLPNFQVTVRLGKYLKDNKLNTLRFTCSDICLGHYLPLKVKIVNLSEHVISVDKYPSIYTR